jgi:hypothetical protein
MLLYANDNNDRYPEPNRWCVLLVDGSYAETEYFLCREDRAGPCSYAMNPNCRSPNANPDLVLLFECEPGWNKFGGREMTTCDHHRGDGLNVLYNNGGTYFEKCTAIDELNWGDEANE